VTGNETARKMSLILAFRQVSYYSFTTQQQFGKNSVNDASLALLLALIGGAVCSAMGKENFGRADN
jgi:hypothetical protein